MLLRASDVLFLMHDFIFLEKLCNTLASLYVTIAVILVFHSLIQWLVVI